MSFERIVGVSPNDIDEEIRDIIYELNKKGWRSRGSCAGHLVNGVFRSQIVFAHNYVFPTFPILNTYDINDNMMIIEYKGHTEEERQAVLDDWREWAKGLPTRNQEAHKYIYSLIGTTKNNRKVYVDVSEDELRIKLERVKLFVLGKYKSLEIKETPMEIW